VRKPKLPPPEPVRIDLTAGHPKLAVSPLDNIPPRWDSALFIQGLISFIIMKGPFCIFVVDDDQSARTGLSRLLRAAGHEVRAFASANEFLDALDPDALGCIVLDVRMPGMSGNELQAELQARNTKLPIIVVTADDDPETRLNAQNMNAAAFFRKPVDGTALLDAIRWALGRDNFH
jgi:FixJ family two-component response regulator